MQTFFVVVKDEKGTTVSSGGEALMDDPVNSSDDSREASGHSAGHESGGPVVTGVLDV